MDIVVMKFGGTSVRDQATRFQAFKHIRREVSAGYKVVVVVGVFLVGVHVVEQQG